MTPGLTDKDYEEIHIRVESPAEMNLANFHKLIVNGYLLLVAKTHYGNQASQLANEVGKDEIHWWIFKREQDLDKLSQETNTILPAAKRLKYDANRLKGIFLPDSYRALVSTLNEFVKDHEQEIAGLYEYVKILGTKDAVVFGMLFTYRVWGTTSQIKRISVNKSKKAVLCKDPQECIETALGHVIRSTPTAYWVGGEMRNTSNLDDIDFEKYLQSPEGAERWLMLTSNTILDLLEDYWDNVLQSLRNILLEIELRLEVENLVTDTEFWSTVIQKMMNSPIEDQLWDFKESLAMWCTSSEIKRREEVDFCENVAAFANAHGGAIMIGVSNDRPRRIIGLTDPENQIKHVADVIGRLCDYQYEFTRVVQVPMKDEYDKTKICLVVVVAQTQSIVGVFNEEGRYSYPQRHGTGISRKNRKIIESSKSKILGDNYNFVAELHKIICGGFISLSYS